MVDAFNTWNKEEQRENWIIERYPKGGGGQPDAIKNQWGLRVDPDWKEILNDLSFFLQKAGRLNVLSKFILKRLLIEILFHFVWDWKLFKGTGKNIISIKPYLATSNGELLIE